MGCSATKVTAIDIEPRDDSTESSRLVSSRKEIPQSVAFEISLENGMSERDVGNPVSGLFRFQPPQRLQKLATLDKEITPEAIAEKQAEAEKRRQEILNQRIQSARRAQAQMQRHQDRSENSVPGLVPEFPEEGNEDLEPIQESAPEP